MKDRKTALKDLRKVYRHPARIQKYEKHYNDWNEEIQEWVDHALVWVSIEPISGREYWAKHQTQSEVTHRVRMHYMPDIKPTMRIVLGQEPSLRVFEIESVIDWEERNEYLQIMCKEAVT